MAKRTVRGRKGKKGKIPIRQNRPNWRKKVLGRKGTIKYRRRGTKIKSKEWEKINL